MQKKTSADGALPSLFSAYNFDRSAMNDGKWMPLRGGRVLIARAGMRRHQQAERDAIEMYGEKAGTGGPDAEAAIAEKITVHAIAYGILLGWEGYSEEYSPTLALRLLQEQVDFREDIFRLASSRETYRRKEMEEAAPNS